MSSIPATYQEDEAIQKKRWVILIVLNLFTFMSTLDGSIVNIALPVLVKQLNLPVAQVEWVTTGYLMAICAVILFFGKLGDMAGKIRIFRIGTVVFIVGSLLCGLSTNLPFLIVSRVIQAVGASMTMANSQGIVTDIFPANERGKALGLIGTFVSLGSIAGPSLGGIIVSTLGWEYIFWVNVPIGLIAIVLGTKVLPKDLIRVKSKIDLPGSLLFSFFIITLFAGLLLGQQFGYSDGRIIAALAAAAVSFAVFLMVELRSSAPLLQLSLFKNPLFSLSILCAFLVFVANFCFNIISPFYAQNMLGLSPFYAGFLLMLFPISMVIIAPLSGALSDRIGSEFLTFAGLIVMVIAQFGLARLHEGSSVILVGLWIAMLGVGSGLFQSPNNSLIMSKVPRTQLGSAGSVNSLVRNVGMVVGITIATSILFNVMSSKAGYRVTGLVAGRPDIFLSGMHVVFMTSSAICLVSALLTGWRMITIRKSKRARA
ncbi:MULTISPECIES: MFS transporter [unclassified Paenibacillus]|uniref:MFS transporter n=1 Tax=unclassified Paenibacillus TaxID=185978 RepID=UPI002406A598|nr:MULTISPECIES: MFS transporter [unclassified Paenibacillus]MDF9844846.1 EmrB/QacA subfamily drug resistance transporter [Paenibacillus sp. PastF-2]MDF9851447.1 EmrB/QacA subfamily drug resistance transporter [Paenibacillus sp. PastM-2]MDF9858023.1 EmrB/QacA subfamily drug resistance transporter [Paenibacillus sp. PastF-1]MDH6483291.1 EmrB/QacA subfamily drug resistance transporter [Paenibacillus sp. PastH-2]MDH6510700.1 EmrB/QacA subfamily drug resistance transporter [Paenibacillus sp. PastM